MCSSLSGLVLPRLQRQPSRRLSAGQLQSPEGQCPPHFPPMNQVCVCQCIRLSSGVALVGLEERGRMGYSGKGEGASNIEHQTFNIGEGAAVVQFVLRETGLDVRNGHDGRRPWLFSSFCLNSGSFIGTRNTRNLSPMFRNSLQTFEISVNGLGFERFGSAKRSIRRMFAWTCSRSPDSIFASFLHPLICFLT